ncbi:MAG: hypothetical protein Q8L48_30950 [Archangium sp.]|nr:hypothetical protein [Archangium sp.]
MRFALSLIGGVIAGALLMAVSLYMLVLPVMRSTRDDEGLLRLEHGSTTWRRVAGGPGGDCTALWSFGEGVVMATDAKPMEWSPTTGWKSTTRTRTAEPVAGSKARWFMLDEGKALTLAEGDCHLTTEPEREALPPFPTCPVPPDTLEAVTRLDDRSTLVLILDDAAQKYRGWRLPAGAATWDDLGTLDVPLASGALVAGPQGRALFISNAGAMLALEDGRWEPLPTEHTARAGQRAAWLADGSVVACGGRRDLRDQTPWRSVAFPLGVLALTMVVAFYAKARPLPLLLGAIGGAVLTGGLALVVIFTSGWH